jgi:hypothetical protein
MRPRAHVIAEMGVNFLERQILRRGHQLQRLNAPEYGTDAEMHHFCPKRRTIENGRVEFQLKATDRPVYSADGSFLRCPVESAHIHFWLWEIAFPVILVLYDASRHRAFWVDVQAAESLKGLEDRESVSIRIPAKNKLTLHAIDHFRGLSLDRMASFLK